MDAHRKRQILHFVLLFLLFLLTWYWSLLTSLLRPTAVRSHLVKSAPIQTVATHEDQFQYARLGIDAPITKNNATSPLEVTDWNKIRTALTGGVSLAFPEDQFADAELAFLTGHSSDSYPHPYDSVFAGLGQAKTGDTFSFSLDQKLFTYRVIQKEVVAPTDIHHFEAYRPKEGEASRVVLVTCWPPLTTQHRLVVVGERMKTNE